jgi:PAS domain S-box-containing protein
MLQQQPEPSRRAPDLPDDVARLAAEYSPEPLLQLDSAGVVRSANPAALAELRYEPHQLIGRALAELLDEGSRAKGAAMLEAAAQGPTEVFELNQRAGDDTIVLVGYRAVPLPGGGALLIGHLMAAVIATTERLIALNRQLNALFAIASVASRSLVLADLLDEVLGLALAELGAQAGAVLLATAPVALVQAGRGRQPAPAAMYLAAQRGFATAIAGRLPDPLALGAPAHGSLGRGEPFVVSGSAEEIGLAPADFAAPVGPLLSLLAVPLRGEDQLLGWLYAVTDRYHTFGAGAIELVRSIGDLLGPPVENARLYGALLDISGQLGAVLDSIDSGVLLIDRDGIVRDAQVTVPPRSVTARTRKAEKPAARSASSWVQGSTRGMRTAGLAASAASSCAPDSRVAACSPATSRASVSSWASSRARCSAASCGPPPERRKCCAGSPTRSSARMARGWARSKCTATSPRRTRWTGSKMSSSPPPRTTSRRP